MWKIVVAVLIWGLPAAPPNFADRPYVSCIDGHIVRSLAECPPLPHHDNNQNPPVGGGGSGILGGLLGGIL